MMNFPVISISNLTKTYSNKPVLKDLNWQIAQGDVVALLGGNGAGKSTLLESIMDLRESESGDLKIWNYSWGQLPQEHREKIAYVAQDTKGFEWMRVKDFLSYLGGFFSNWDRDYSEQLQSRWGLESRQRVGDLSGGQTQIMHIIQALATKPELLVLDEPVAHLDTSLRRQFLAELIELSFELKSTVIFSSHIVSDLERVANKVALLQNGKINHYYDVEELKASIARVKISGSELIEKTKEFANFDNWQKYATGATAIIVKPSCESVDKLAARLNIQIEATPMSLEDWYLEVSRVTNY